MEVERGMKRHLLLGLLIACATLGGLHQMLLMLCWRLGGSPSVSQAGSFLGSAGLLLRSLQPEIASLRPLACSATFPSVPSSQNCCLPFCLSLLCVLRTLIQVELKAQPTPVQPTPSF